MNEVFQYYNICDDVANIIARKVHQSYQIEINKRIRIMVGFDWNYNYWNGENTENEVPKSDLYVWMDKHYDFLDCRNLDIKEYSYMCKRYQVFSLNRPLRINLFILKGDDRLIDEIDDRRKELKITQLINSFNNNIENINFLRRTTACLECKYTDWQSKVLTLLSISLIGINGINNMTNVIFR